MVVLWLFGKFVPLYSRPRVRHNWEPWAPASYFPAGSSELSPLPVFLDVAGCRVHGVAPIPFYSQSSSLDPADIKSIQYFIGRAEDRRKWGLVDCSGPLAHALFTEADQLAATPLSG